MDVVLENGLRTTLHHLHEDGCWVQLRLTPDAAIFPQTGRTSVVNVERNGDEMPFAGFASVLVRPDGYIGPVLLATE